MDDLQDEAKRVGEGTAQQAQGAPAQVSSGEGGEKVAECVKDDATPENVEAMIKANL